MSYLRPDEPRDDPVINLGGTEVGGSGYRPRRASPSAPEPTALVFPVAAVLCALTTLLGPSPARWVSGLLLVSYLPGRAIRKALPETVNRFPVSFAVDVATSLVCTVMVGLAADATTPGIRPGVVAPSLAAITVLVSASVMIFRSQNPARRKPNRDVKKWSLVIPVGTFTVMATAAVAISVRSNLAATERVSTTELSVLPVKNGHAHVTVTNLEHVPETYRLVISTGLGQGKIRTLDIPAGASEVIDTVTPSMRRVTASLYDGSATTLLRQAWLQPDTGSKGST